LDPMCFHGRWRPQPLIRRMHARRRPECSSLESCSHRRPAILPFLALALGPWQRQISLSSTVPATRGELSMGESEPHVPKQESRSTWRVAVVQLQGSATHAGCRSPATPYPGRSIQRTSGRASWTHAPNQHAGGRRGLALSDNEAESLMEHNGSMHASSQHKVSVAAAHGAPTRSITSGFSSL
jgi:hypothetical protein